MSSHNCDKHKECQSRHVNQSKMSQHLTLFTIEWNSVVDNNDETSCFINYYCFSDVWNHFVPKNEIFFELWRWQASPWPRAQYQGLCHTFK